MVPGTGIVCITRTQSICIVPQSRRGRCCNRHILFRSIFPLRSLKKRVELFFLPLYVGSIHPSVLTSLVDLDQVRVYQVGSFQLVLLTIVNALSVGSCYRTQATAEILRSSAQRWARSRSWFHNLDRARSFIYYYGTRYVDLLQLYTVCRPYFPL